MRIRFHRVALICAGLSACTPPPPVEQSREALWTQFAHQPIDSVLVSWGPPARETRLTDGSRLVTYHHATIYDAASPYQRQTGCEVTFMAKEPRFRIENIAMQGDAFECSMLAQGRIGDVIQNPAPAGPYIGGYYGRGYRYPF